MGFSLGAISTGISIVGGITDYWSSKKSAEDQRDNAEERARSLEYHADREYAHNSGEYKRAYTLGVLETFRQSASEIYGLSSQKVKLQSEILASTGNAGSSGVYSSSARADALSQLDSDYEKATLDMIANKNFNLIELTHEFNANMKQLELNRDKMKDDIGYSLTNGYAQADYTERMGQASAIKSFGKAFETYNRWYLGGKNEE